MLGWMNTRYDWHMDFPMYQKGWRTAFGQKRNKIRKLFEISSMLLAWLLWASSNLSSSLHLLHCFLFCNHPISCTESFKYQIRLIPRKIFWSFNFQSDIMTSVSPLSKLTKVFYFFVYSASVDCWSTWEKIMLLQAVQVHKMTIFLIKTVIGENVL